MSRGFAGWGAVAVLAVAAAALNGLSRTQDRFDHVKHARVFPLCTTCHQGVVTEGAALWPTAASCAACHDGSTQPTVEWSPPPGPRAGNLRFVHTRHAEGAARKNPADSLLGLTCTTCHAEAGAPRMTVQHAQVGRCLDCHQLGPTHLAVPDTACATCHLTLVEARTFTRAHVAAFPEPPSHDRLGWELEGHGRAARLAGVHPDTPAISASCATCHARNFCITCHVNAPEVGPIQALGLDERSTAIPTALPVPESHLQADFQYAHGGQARRSVQSCAACHTRESCTTCHAGVTPAPVTRLASAGPGRGPGAQLTRKAPATHTWEFSDRHGAQAGASGATCQSCHVREDCLSCHRPGPAGNQDYHPAGFLTRHPTAAWAREANCSDCHNVGQFCQSCHRMSGITAGGPRAIGIGNYHDAKGGWGLGHGQAARQALESCASCHAERDCTRCHSSVAGGFRFSPHGPGFNAERLLRKNPSLCVACHGQAIPRR